MVYGLIVQLLQETKFDAWYFMSNLFGGFGYYGDVQPP